MSVDHRDLLRRYIAHVRLCAEANGFVHGHYPLDIANGIVGCGVPFSDDEITELRHLAADSEEFIPARL